MNPFRSFPTEAAPVEKTDGATAGPYEFIFAGDKLVTWDVNADLNEGDTILRNLPNGKTQRLEVKEVTFNQQVSRIPAHFLIVPSRMIGWFIIGVPCCWVARP